MGVTPLAPQASASASSATFASGLRSSSASCRAEDFSWRPWRLGSGWLGRFGDREGERVYIRAGELRKSRSADLSQNSWADLGERPTFRQSRSGMHGNRF
jgi:hypothetical protein